MWALLFLLARWRPRASRETGYGPYPPRRSRAMNGRGGPPWPRYSNAPGLERLVQPLRQLFDVLGRPVRDLHTEMEAHLSQHFLDLVQRLAAEVRGSEHLRLGLLYQIADVDDVVVLEAVCRAD